LGEPSEGVGATPVTLGEHHERFSDLRVVAGELGRDLASSV
jgi:hypothetical protein